ncbi:MAG: alpha/beta hydrolase [Pseudomonadota bacterium]
MGLFRYLLLTGLLFFCGHAHAETALINGVDLDFEIRGAGPPVYLLHGGMESRKSYDALAPALAGDFTVVALDSREQGRSGPADAQISYALMASDLLALADHLGHERFSIVGLSDGGITALTAALRTPERVDRLVLLGAVYHFEAYPEETRKFIAQFEWDGDVDPQTYPGIFVEHYLTGRDDLSGFGVLLREMATMWTTSPTFEQSDLSRVTAKTLVVNGDRDDVPLNHVVELYDGLPDAQLFIVPGGTHYALQEKPALVNGAISTFLTASR